MKKTEAVKNRTVYAKSRFYGKTEALASKAIEVIERSGEEQLFTLMSPTVMRRVLEMLNERWESRPQYDRFKTISLAPWWVVGSECGL